LRFEKWTIAESVNAKAQNSESLSAAHGKSIAVSLRGEKRTVAESRDANG
jgi:hypothetical protein